MTTTELTTEPAPEAVRTTTPAAGATDGPRAAGRPPAAAGALRAALALRFGGLPRPFWIVIAGTIVNRVGATVVPFLVFFLGARGIAPGATGAVVLALGLGGTAGAVLGGWLADRIGARSALLAGLLLAPASLGALFAAPTLPLLAAAALAVGATGKIYPPAAGALLAGSVTGPRRTRAFSLLHWAINIGAACAAALAGFLAAHGFLLLFLIDAATSLAFALLVAVGIPRDGSRPAAGAARHPSGRPHGSGYGLLLRDRLMILFVLLSLAQETVYSLTEFAIPLAVRLDGLSPAVFGTAAAVNALLVVGLQPFLYPRLSRLPRIPVLAAAWCVVGVGVATTGLAHSAWQYVATTAVWSVGEVIGGIVAGGIGADLAPDGAQGRYQGALMWTGSLARLLGPAVTTGLFATTGPAVLWWGTAATGVLGAVVLLRMAPALRHRAGR
ncbi:MFS transporter [Micromonospora sp. NPDC049559]|uniref:MFS transporter n=1 Tax=Micromonospora sp. NPDC049559 TaxID=3155923 RepID=UPI003444C8D3